MEDFIKNIHKIGEVEFKVNAINIIHKYLNSSPELKTVHFAKILQNAKGIFTVAGDPKYLFEVTYNGDKGEFYLDDYRPFKLFDFEDRRVFAKERIAFVANKFIDKTDGVKIKESDVFTVWECHSSNDAYYPFYTSYLSTTLPDGMYYYFTEQPMVGTRVIAYKKYENVCFPLEEV